MLVLMSICMFEALAVRVLVRSEGCQPNPARTSCSYSWYILFLLLVYGVYLVLSTQLWAWLGLPITVYTHLE